MTSSAVETVRTYLADNQIEHEETTRDGVEGASFSLTLPGEKKLQTPVRLDVGAHALAVHAFVCRNPDENHARVHRWLLERNLRMYAVSFAVDRHGDIYLEARLPLASVGIYVPGGRAAYPSSLLMNAIPAQVAGVAALWLSHLNTKQFWKMGVSLLCIAGAMFLGLSNLIEYLFGLNINVHELLFKEPDKVVGTLAPNRMAFTTAVNFTLSGAALLLLNIRTARFYPISQYLAITVSFIGFLTLIVYFYGLAPRFEGLAFYTQMAANTAFCFFLLGMGVLFAKPQHGFAAIFTSKKL